ncbi:prolyl oligopeptidase family serine peptidase [Acidimicrobiia bacterium EGI L10123]|uniref:S9 family peptidase n=1 Tax=Salinilacustrithrix flava TaxID=2957203 RepID=UPI003D7C15EB|nr:prolyl oligopeptidase family serine peptidase [Acidimicrobiia bacterium EGI L10123]
MADRTAFHDLDRYLDLPRVAGLALSPDGTRLVTSLGTLSSDRTRYVQALWELDPTGEAPARRLTRSAKGEHAPAFLPDGTLLFTSARPGADTDGKDEDPPALWAQPPGAGDARIVARRPGGIGGAVTATRADVVVVQSDTLPGAVSAADDQERRKTRKDRKVSAILHESYPIRYWDHDLGPDQPRLLLGRNLGARDEPVDLADLTPVPGRRFDETDVSITPDGRTVLATAARPEGGGTRSTLIAIDTSSRTERTLLHEPGHEFSGATISPDGTRAVVVRESDGDTQEPLTSEILLLDLTDGSTTALAPGWDRWAGGFAWVPDGSAVLCIADEHGAAPVFRIELADGTVTRLTTDHGAYSDLQVSPDGASAYAVRSAVDHPPAVVRLDARTPAEPAPLPGPAETPALPGTLDEVTATALDGTPLRGWLALPHGASETPAPLLLWIHGGPLGSWNAWSWRWNPWLAVAQGYAVLLPDPALSTGYGLDFIRRGWGRWGDAPYTDLLAITDAAEARDDVDETRTAAMGGSFGGYMANWVAGHTDRFDCIVTHASLWALESFGPTTDRADYWRREMDEAMAAEWSPHRLVEHMTTPMLVIHGDKDYRVPIGEALNLWSELARHHGRDDGSLPHKLLYFPDENHWILTPQHAKVWYEVVLGFLDHHLRDADWSVPDTLR